VISQLKKHMAKLRKDYEWKRKREHYPPSLDESPAS